MWKLLPFCELKVPGLRHWGDMSQRCSLVCLGCLQLVLAVTKLGKVQDLKISLHLKLSLTSSVHRLSTRQWTEHVSVHCCRNKTCGILVALTSPCSSYVWASLHSSLATLFDFFFNPFKKYPL